MDHRRLPPICDASIALAAKLALRLLGLWPRQVSDCSCSLAVVAVDDTVAVKECGR